MENQETIQIKTEIEEEPYEIQENLYFNQESFHCPVKEEQQNDLQSVIKIKSARGPEKSIHPEVTQSRVVNPPIFSPGSKIQVAFAGQKPKTKVIFRPDSISFNQIQEPSEKESQPKNQFEQNKKIKFRKNCYKCGEIMNNPRFYAKHISTCQKVISPKSSNSQSPKSVNFGAKQKLELITSFPVSCEICCETIISKKHFFEHTLEHAKLRKYPVARKLPQSTNQKTKVIYRPSMNRAETSTAASSNNSPSLKQVSISTKSDFDSTKGTKVNEKRPSNEAPQFERESKNSKPKSKSKDKLQKGNFKCQKCLEYFTDIKQFVDHMMQHSKNKDKVPLNFEVSEDSSSSDQEEHKVANNIFPVNCANCEEKLYSKKHYLDHMMNHSANCRICNLTFDSIVEMKNHNNEFHPYVCNICKSTFTHLPRYKEHLLTH